jgi:NADH-quinone oxidoreductase subunit I
MMNDRLNERVNGTQEYMLVEDTQYPKTPWEEFKQVVNRSVQGELLGGLKVTWNIMNKALFKDDMHTVIYPQEKLPISPRYRAIHNLLSLLESGTNRCIGCGLCEKICVANCIRIDAKYDENQRKEVVDYTINLGRCIYCGYCAEVCPELAIVHGNKYENASEQRAHYIDKERLLTPKDKLHEQVEFEGFGAISPDADEKIKKTPLAY